MFKVSCLLGFVFLSISVLAQAPTVLDNLANNYQELSNEHQRTEIYLQTNKDIYETQEDLWFKAYNLDAHLLMPSVIDSTLYVQLSKEYDTAHVWQGKFQISNGFSKGHIFIPDSLTNGNYFLKAYSKSSFFKSTKEFNAVRKIKIINSVNSTIKKDTTGTLVESDKKLDFQTFPEGGSLIDGMKANVAFKAVKPDGLPQAILGKLYENDSVLLKLKSTHAGMGSFQFTPDISKSYHIELENMTTQPNRFKLPTIKNKGIGLSVWKQTEDSLFLKVSSNQRNVQKIYIRAQVRGTVQAMAMGNLEDSLKIALPISEYPQGICEITLFNQELKPVTERLVYVNQQKKLYIQVELTKKIYQTREKVILTIKSLDVEGNPVKAHLGVSVYDQIYSNPAAVKNIKTHYNLSTQLKGVVYNPQYYFDSKNKHRKRDLDLLMLTQGWRNYVWNEENLKTEKERVFLTDGIKGKVHTVKKKKESPDQQMVMAFNPNKGEEKFFIALDRYQDFYAGASHLSLGSQFFIRHFESKGEKIIIQTIDGFDELKKLEDFHIINYPLAIEKEEERQPISEFELSGGIALEAVSVSGKKANVFRNKYVGQLDSLVKLNINNDYVCNSNFLNCEVHVNHDENIKPVEGETYMQYIGFKWNDSKTAYTIQGRRSVEYHYPSYSEKELLEKFNLVIVDGYQEHKEFYQPKYDKKENDSIADYRNTLLWAPEVITDSNGKATLEFYTSDINTYFIGNIEGVSSEGLLGSQEFEFFVSKND